jgi:hypothetical protein
LGDRKTTFGQGLVAEEKKKREEEIKNLIEYEGRKGVKFTGLEFRVCNNPTKLFF